MLYGQRSGYLYDKLRYKKKADKNHNTDDVIDDYPVAAHSESSLDEQMKNELMQYFKNCVVDRNKEELKEKLKSCVEFRREILNEPQQPIYKIFGFYFVDPELVKYKINFTFRDIV